MYIPYIITTYYKYYSKILQNVGLVLKSTFVFTSANGLNKTHSPLNINWVLDVGK